jgi:hypothetical protein
MTESGGQRRGVPDLLVEQLALGELDEATAERVRARLDETGDAGEALTRLDASNAEILADYPATKVAADIRRRLEREQEAQRPKRSVLPWVLVPAAAAAAALVWVIVHDPEPTTIAEHVEIVDDGEPERTRIKGAVDPHLVIDRRTAEGHERLGAGEVVREGDLLQLSYVPAGRPQGVIVSIDGAGAVTLHHPTDEGAAPDLVEGAEVPLGHSYELDDAPSFERFVFVTREGEAPSVAAVIEAAEGLARDPERARSQPLELAGPGWEQHSLLLRKGPRAPDAEGEPGEAVPAGQDRGPEPDEQERGEDAR